MLEEGNFLTFAFTSVAVVATLRLSDSANSHLTSATNTVKLPTGQNVHYSSPRKIALPHLTLLMHHSFHSTLRKEPRPRPDLSSFPDEH